MAWIASLSVLLLTTAVILSWIFGVTHIVRLSETSEPMQFNTALGLFACAIALLGIHIQSRAMILIGALIAGAIGFLTAIQFLLQINLGIDSLFVSPLKSDTSVYPGRPGPNTTLCLCVCSIALLLPAIRKPTPFGSGFIVNMGGLATILAAVSMLGYLSGFEFGYSWGAFSGMSPQTAISFFLIGSGIAGKFISRDVTYADRAQFWRSTPLVATCVLLVLSFQAYFTIRSNEVRFQSLMTQDVADEIFQELDEIIQDLRETTLNLGFIHMDLKNPRWPIYAAEERIESIDGKLMIYGLENTLLWSSSGDEPVRSEIRNTISDILETHKNQLDSHNAKTGSITSSVVGDMLLFDVLTTNTSNNQPAVIVCIASVPRLFNHASSAIDPKGEFESAITVGTTRHRVPSDKTEGAGLAGREVREYIVEDRPLLVAEIWPAQTTIESAKTPFSTVIVMSGLFLTVMLSLVVSFFLSTRAFVSSLEEKDQETRRVSRDLQQLQNQAVDQHAIVAITNVDGVITYCNDRFCEISGYSREELVGQTHRIVNSGTHGKDFFVSMWRTIASGRVWQGDICNRAKDGSLYWVNTTITPFKDDEGAITKFVAIRTDVTAHRRAEQRIKQINKELVQRAKEMEQITYMVSHDLKSPIVTIQGYNGFLHQDLEAGRTDRLIGFSEAIRSASERMQRLLDDLLLFNKIGKAEREHRPIQTSSLIQKLIDGLAPMLDSVHAEIDVQADLPDLYGDSSSLHQVFQNLITNAIKYGRSDDGVLRLTIGGEQTEEQIRVWVADEGPGIDPRFRDKVFEVFNRLQSEFEGTGVGLAIVKRVAEAHGGSVWVEESESGGAKFVFSAPLTHTTPQLTEIGV